MSLPSQYVDISKFPEDEKPHILDLATKHNALALDVDGISGRTPEEKQEFHGLMGVIRRVFHFCHGKRFHILVGLATVNFGLNVSKQLGLSPEQASRLLEATLKLLEKLANG